MPSKSNIPVLEIAGKYYELAELVKQTVQEDFNEIGLTLVEFFIENVSLSKAVEETIDKRTSIGVMEGKMGSYAQMESIGAMRVSYIHGRPLWYSYLNFPSFGKNIIITINASARLT